MQSVGVVVAPMVPLDDHVAVEDCLIGRSVLHEVSFARMDDRHLGASDYVGARRREGDPQVEIAHVRDL
jgi:hypothetical protein